MYDSLLRPLLFRLDAESAHHLGMWSLSLAETACGVASVMRQRVKPDRSSLKMHVAGLDFPNPVGLGAGLDKNAEAMVGLFSLGFGAIEVGTVTPRAQPGNDKPRVFRIPEYQAVINRMGFNNEGVDAMAARLRELEWRPAPIGVNIGKNKDTPNERAVDDYLACAAKLSALGDYVVVNLSSPNTPGLRALQDPEVLAGLLRAVRTQVVGRPLFLKIAPDLGDEAVDAVVDVARDCGADGLICTNTTITRPVKHPTAHETGGLSGKPLFTRSTEVVRRAFKRTGGKLPIVGVGGIFSGEDAWQKICAGASLVQIYTGFIYRGPALVKEILDTLEEKLSDLGLDSLQKAVGRDA
ncbi:MAG: quinone-dependent dihydroorotate dehydrogenase [Archangium sp.]|nr:quinone-dependent dihydroorotate dehydrogenase [Archangium sp.]